jgi:hypothetical protein
MSPLCKIEMTLPGGFPGVLGVTVRLMSDGELSRLVLRDLDQKRLTTEAARLLGVMWSRAYKTSILRRGPQGAGPASSR